MITKLPVENMDGISQHPCRGYLLKTHNLKSKKWKRYFFAIVERRQHWWPSEIEYIQSMDNYISKLAQKSHFFPPR